MPSHFSENPFRALIRVFGTGRQVMEPFFSQFGISAAQWAVLRAIRRAEEEGVVELRLTDLSTRLLIRPPSVTTVIDRLERAGLVRRTASESDRRAKMIALTPAGEQCVDGILAGYDAQIDKVMGGLSLAEQKQLLGLLGRMQAHLDQLAKALPGADSAISDSDIESP